MAAGGRVLDRGSAQEAHGYRSRGGTRAVALLAGLIACACLLLAAAPALAAPPGNDDFANAESLSGTSASTTGTNAEATAEAGEPNPTGNGGTTSIWYSWTAPEDSKATVDLDGSTIDTVLGVYTGSAVDSLTTVAEGDDDPDDGSLQSKVSFNAVDGTTYFFEVNGYSGAEGAISLTLTTDTTGDLDGIAYDYLGNGMADVCVDAFTAPGVSAGQDTTDITGSWASPTCLPATT